MVVAASGSVGATTAPRVNAAAQGIPAIAMWATTATPTVVRATSSTADRLIGRT